MKYNDRASRQFQQRSIDKDPMDYYHKVQSNRERERKRKIKEKMRLTLKHGICRVMNNEEKSEFYQEFKGGTNGRWSNWTNNHDFNGNFIEFIDYLEKKGDERILKLRIKLREHNIHIILK